MGLHVDEFLGEEYFAAIRPETHKLKGNHGDKYDETDQEQGNEEEDTFAPWNHLTASF